LLPLFFQGHDAGVLVVACPEVVRGVFGVEGVKGGEEGGWEKGV